jgi:hypothetical protein
VNHHLTRQPPENGIVPVNYQGSILLKGKFTTQEATEFSPMVESGMTCEMLHRGTVDPTQNSSGRVDQSLPRKHVIGSLATGKHLIFGSLKTICPIHESRIPHSLNKLSSRETIRHQRHLLTSEILHYV